ncbi:MAG TPA: DUF6165 family protein [Rhizomicrobium sp.]|jgi:hypothetical protein
MTARSVAAPQIPVSWGELIDKITILEIKSEKIHGEGALANIRNELDLLHHSASPVLATNEPVLHLKMKLRTINEMLWTIEDSIREKEAAGDFGAEFVALARSVYKHNDERAALKRNINEALPCGIAEEKSYAK